MSRNVVIYLCLVASSWRQCNGQGIVLSEAQIEQYSGWARIAARAGDSNYLKRLYDHQDVGPQLDVNAVDANGLSALHWGARFGRVTVTEVLLGFGADVNLLATNHETPLMSAAYGNFDEVGQVLLGAGADPDIQDVLGHTALILTARLKYTEFAELLLSHNATTSTKMSDAERSALIWAAIEGGHGVAKALIDHGAEINIRDKDDHTPLIWSSKLGHTDVVSYLLASGADPNLVTATGDTALMWAAYGNFMDIAKDLVENGANVDAQEEEGWTALMGASVQGHDEMVEYLLSLNASATATNDAGHTALTLTAALDNGDISDMLSDASVITIDAQDNKGMTPLVHAAANDFFTVFKILAYKCPNISITDATGKSAMDYAIMHNNTYAIALLKMMADPECVRFGVFYKLGDVVYQDCLSLVCHCTGQWKLVGDKDPNCGIGKSQILTLQRSRKLNKVERSQSVVTF